MSNEHTIWNAMHSLLLLAALVIVVGDGENRELSALQAEPQTISKTQAETKEDAKPWETPAGLVLLIAQKLENKHSQIIALKRIASAQIETGQREQALATLEQALNVAQADPHQIGKPSGLRHVASALATVGEFERALDVAQTIDNANYKTSALCDIAATLMEAGDKEQVLATLKLALEVAQSKEGNYFGHESDHNLGRVDESLANAGEFEQAKKIMQTIQKKDSALSGIVAALAKAEDIKQAQQLTDQIENLFTKIVALRNIAISQIKQGEIENASITLERSLHLAQQVDNISLKVTALREIAVGQFELDDRTQAIATVQQAVKFSQEIVSSKKGGTTGSALINIVFVLAVAGEIEQALKITQSLEHPIDKIHAQCRISLVLLESGDREQALTIINRSVEGVSEIEFRHRKIEARMEIAATLAQAGELSRAFKLAKKIKKANRSPFNLTDAKTIALFEIAFALATEPLPQKPQDNPYSAPVRRMKRTFTPEEQQLARQLIEALPEN